MKRFFDILGNILIVIFMAIVIFATLNCYIGFIPEGAICEATKTIYTSFSTLAQNWAFLGALIIIAWFSLKAIFVEKVFTKIVFIILVVATVICIFFPTLLDSIFGGLALSM